MSLRNAPRRKVTNMWRTGNYGNVTWHHELECGHIESRKRKAPADSIGCEQCLEPDAAINPASEEYLGLVDNVTMTEQTRDRVARVLAEKLGIPTESVSVLVNMWDGKRVDGARISLDRDAVEAILRR